MEHIVRFVEGFDCIKFECAYDSDRCKPGEGGSHGKHGLEIKFFSVGDEGAVQFILSTGWIPQQIDKDSIGHRGVGEWGSLIGFMPSDLGAHSKKPMYEGHNPISESCEFCDDKPCYYDGSGLNASDAMYALVNGGEKALWEFLDAYYLTVFEDAKYPEPAEYSKPKREDLQ